MTHEQKVLADVLADWAAKTPAEKLAELYMVRDGLASARDTSIDVREIALLDEEIAELTDEINEIEFEKDAA